MLTKVKYFLIGILVIGVLWFFVSLISNPYIIPSPLKTFESFIDNYNTHLENFLQTGYISFLGLFLSLIITNAVLGVIVLIPKLEEFIYPLLVMLKATPAVAIAPIIVALIGTGTNSKTLVASLISFFPIIIGGLDGIKRVPKPIELLGNNYGAKNINKMKHLQLGYLIDGILSGLKTAAPLSVVGAIVSEYIIGGSESGIGTFIISNIYSSTPVNVFIGAILSTFLGLAFFFISIVVFDFYEKRLRIYT